MHCTHSVSCVLHCEASAPQNGHGRAEPRASANGLGPFTSALLLQSLFMINLPSLSLGCSVEDSHGSIGHGTMRQSGCCCAIGSAISPPMTTQATATPIRLPRDGKVPMFRWSGHCGRPPTEPCAAANPAGSRSVKSGHSWRRVAELCVRQIRFRVEIVASVAMRPTVLRPQQIRSAMRARRTPVSLVKMGHRRHWMRWSFRCVWRLTSAEPVAPANAGRASGLQSSLNTSFAPWLSGGVRRLHRLPVPPQDGQVP